MSGQDAKGGMVTGPANGPTLTGEYWVKFFSGNGEQTAHQHKTDGSIVYWRRKADGTWIKHPNNFAYQPWRPRIQHSCDVAR